jgi:hypothetical protein
MGFANKDFAASSPRVVDENARTLVNYGSKTGNRLIGADEIDGPPLIESVEQLECESQLDGLLKSYRRAA